MRGAPWPDGNSDCARRFADGARRGKGSRPAGSPPAEGEGRPCRCRGLGTACPLAEGPRGSLCLKPLFFDRILFSDNTNNSMSCWNYWSAPPTSIGNCWQSCRNVAGMLPDGNPACCRPVKLPETVPHFHHRDAHCLRRSTMLAHDEDRKCKQPKTVSHFHHRDVKCLRRSTFFARAEDNNMQAA